MSRARMMVGMLVLTLAAVIGAVMFGGDWERPAEARIVTVEKGDIRLVAALSGRLAYQDETVAFSVIPGIVDEILVREGERVAKGQALIRLKEDGLERAAAVWAQQEKLQETASSQDMQRLLQSAVIRSPGNAVVRQVLTAENMPVGAGAAVVTLSSSEQLIVCTAAEADAAKIRMGMDAELYLNGGMIGKAEVAEVSDLAADAMTGRLVSQITLRPDQRLDLPSGAAVEADVLLEEHEYVNILPLEAITDRDTVWWVHEGRCTEIPAEIVLSDEISAWVKLPEGLAAAVGEYGEGQRVKEVQP